MTKFQVVLSSIVTALWVISLGIRVLRPGDGIDFGVLDKVVLLVFAFIFGVGAIKKMNGASEEKK